MSEHFFKAAKNVKENPRRVNLHTGYLLSILHLPNNAGESGTNLQIFGIQTAWAWNHHKNGLERMEDNH
jgi:hypothetical protein